MILDKQTALERIEQDLELYAEICEIFRHDVPQIMDRLKEALQTGDIPVATRHAHSLKSSAANIGANDLSTTAYRTEIAFRANDIENIQSLIAELELNLSCVMNALA
jgi:two-component system sensor histidine kinase/response regulator